MSLAKAVREVVGGWPHDGLVLCAGCGILVSHVFMLKLLVCASFLHTRRISTLFAMDFDLN